KAGSEGMVQETEYTVTAGETGYPGLGWSDNLTFSTLKSSQVGVPSLDSLTELPNFIEAFKTSTLFSAVPELLGLNAAFPSDLYENALQQRISDNVSRGERGALIEPLFITEAKVLLELITKIDTGHSDSIFD